MNRRCFFGGVHAACVQLTPVGCIAERFWSEIQEHFGGVDVDEFVVMPNHLHGILVIEREAGREDRRPAGNRFGALQPGSLQAIVHSFKAAVTRWCRRNGHQEFAWQPRFHEHIIRSEKELLAIRQYIRTNPAQWEIDEDNPNPHA